MQAAEELQGVVLHDQPALIDHVARLLSREWPTQGFASRKVLLHANCATSAHKQRALPCHLALVQVHADGTADSKCGVVAHCRLQQISVQAQTTATDASLAVTSMVVAPAWRRRGAGRRLLRFAEAHAAALGCRQLYLWTADQQPFYRACGYEECAPAAAAPAPLASPDRPARSRLQALFGAQGTQTTEMRTGAACTGAAPGPALPERPASPGVTWLRKRIAPPEEREAGTRASDRGAGSAWGEPG